MKFVSTVVLSFAMMLGGVSLVIGGGATFDQGSCDGEWCITNGPQRKNEFCCSAGECPSPESEATDCNDGS